MSAFNVIFCILLTFLTNLSFITTEELDPNISIVNENIINILASKVSLNETDHINNATLEHLLYGNESEIFDNANEYMDFSSLNQDTILDIYKIAERKNLMAEMEFNNTVGRRMPNWKEAFYDWPFFPMKALDLMRQSIYATRYRLQHTKALRKKMSRDIAYAGALMYGSMMQLRLKMDNIYTTMSKFHPRNTKFIFYLILYERCLTIHVDVTSMVQRIFDIQNKLKDLFAGFQ